MQCEEVKNVLFEFSDGTLAEGEREEVDRHLQQCAECSGLLAEIWEMQLLASSWRDQAAPALDHRRVIGARVAPGIHWIHFASLAASLALFVALAFQVELRATDTGIAVAFGGDPDRVTRADLDAQLSARDDRLERLLEDNMQKLTVQQVATNQLLLRSVLETSRQERREDLSTVMAVWQSDRERMEQATGESLGYLIRNQAAGQRELRQISSTLRGLGLQEDNHL